MNDVVKLNCFKSYDIRGRLNEELNEDIAWRIGRAFAALFKPVTVVVGGDSRLTSKSLKASLTRGLLESGVNVIDIGLSGTEEIYFATGWLNIDGGIQVTASHNPIDYNGMKIVRGGARPLSGDKELRELQKCVEENNFPHLKNTNPGNYSQRCLKNEYVSHLLSFITGENLKPLKLVINSGNGAAGPVIDEIENRFNDIGAPIEIIKVHHNPDGTFPNGIPNPLLPECRHFTRNAVINHGADIGIAFDGDFDRCFLFDEKGNFIEGYYIVGLLAAAFLKKQPGSVIIHDPRLTWNTQEVVKMSGGRSLQSQTGHVFMKEMMRIEDAVYGGEMSAHHYFRDFFYCDSGMIPWLLVIELLSLSKCNLSDLVANFINSYPSSGEINIRLKNASDAIEKVKAVYSPLALHIDNSDGISIEFKEWRFNLRISNTESLLRLNVESRGNKPLMDIKTHEILSILKG